MFHINDLDAMDEAQIKETAEAMGIKRRHPHLATKLSKRFLTSRLSLLQKTLYLKAAKRRRLLKSKSPVRKRRRKLPTHHPMEKQLKARQNRLTNMIQMP